MKPTKYSTSAEYRLCKVRENDAPGVGALIDTPDAAADYWRANIAPQIDGDKEHLVVLMIDTKARAKGHVFVSIGTLNETCAHPREILRPGARHRVLHQLRRGSERERVEACAQDHGPQGSHCR